MSIGADEGQPVLAVRQFRLRDGQDTDSSDSEDGVGWPASRWRGGASAAATAGSRLADVSQRPSSLTATVAPSALHPPRAGSSSSLELFTSSSRSSSPARSALPPDFRKPMAAAAITTTQKGVLSEKMSRSTTSSGSNTHPPRHDMDSRKHGDSDTAQTRQYVQSAGSPVRALCTSTATCSTMEEERQTMPGETIAGYAAVVVAVASAPSPTASNTPALCSDAVQPRSAATGFFERIEASPPKAVDDAGFTTSFTSFSAGAAAGRSQAAVSTTAMAALRGPASPSATAPSLPGTTSMRSTIIDATPTVAAAVVPVYTGGPSEVRQEPLQTKVGVVVSPMRFPKVPLAASSSSSSSDDAATLLAPVRVARSASAGYRTGDVDTAIPGQSIRKLTVPLTTAAVADTSTSSASPQQPPPFTTQSFVAAAARQTVTPTEVSTAAPHDGSSASGSGCPVLSGPGGVMYNRVSAQGRGFVPSSVLEAPSRPRWHTLQSEHTTSRSFLATVVQPVVIPAAPSSPPGSTLSTQAACAAEPLSAAAHASSFSTSPPSVNLPARPQRQAPRLPGAIRTSAVLSLIEDDDAERQCSSFSATSALLRERSRVDTGQPKTVDVQRRGPPSSPSASPPLPPPLATSLSPVQRAVSSVDRAASPLVSRSAALTAAQRQWEAALVIYDDRVPPAKRRAKNQALAVTGKTAALAFADPVSAYLLRGLRKVASQEGKRENLLTCRPVLRIGGGAAMRRNYTSGFSEKHPLDGRVVNDDDDYEAADDSDGATRGSRDNHTALYGSTDLLTGHRQYPGWGSADDRSARVTRYSTSNHTVQHLFSEARRQQRKVDVDFSMSGTGNGGSMSCVMMHLERQGAQTARVLKATHSDVSSGALPPATLPTTAASRTTAVSPRTDEAVSVDLLNYRHSRRKQ
nr:unnamed protein product [Leishmania braziliensis]